MCYTSITWLFYHNCMKIFYFICALLALPTFNCSTYKICIGVSDFIDESLEPLNKPPQNATVTEKQTPCIKKYLTPCFIILSISAIFFCILNKYYKTIAIESIIPIDDDMIINNNVYCDAFFNSIKPFIENEENSISMIYAYCHNTIDEFKKFCIKNKCFPKIEDYKFLLKHFANLNNYCCEIFLD